MLEDLKTIMGDSEYSYGVGINIYLLICDKFGLLEKFSEVSFRLYHLVFNVRIKFSLSFLK